MPEGRFKDHFSSRPDLYRRYRPDYPSELFDRLVARCRRRRLAWDCACGSGQATAALAPRFDRVIATDASRRQLASGVPLPGVLRTAALAEAPPLASGSVDLVTVAQALHWFRLDAFYAEVRRVAAPGAVISVWTYALFEVSPRLDDLMRRFAYETVGPYWPPERRWVDDGYRSLDFPFEPVEALDLAMHTEWSLPQLVGYLRTWSAVRRAEAERAGDPVGKLLPELTAAWGDATSRRVRFPLRALVGSVEDG